MNKCRAVTLVDVVVVMAIAVFLLAIVAPAVIHQGWGNSDRIKCAQNLRQICLAMKMYANNEVRTNAYPRTIYQPDGPPTQFTGSTSPNPFTGSPAQGPNDVTGAIFLLLRTQRIQPESFVCPGTTNAPFQVPAGQSIQSFSNFQSQSELGYSTNNPYPTKAAISNGFQYNDSMTADFALMADFNPGTQNLLTAPPGSTSSKLNSPNHGFAGQNVSYADGHVEWRTNPFAGTQGDNIFTFGPNPASAHRGSKSPIGLNGSSMDGNDSILLPTWDPAVPMPAATFGLVTLTLVGFGVLVLIGGAAFLLWFLLRKPTATHSAPPPIPQ